MEDINIYIQQPQSKRQEHLDLDSPCIERCSSPNGISLQCKGLLAHILDTSIPTGCKIHLCHACHNAKCSNPNHLYWGTASENAIDRMKNGGLSIWEKTVLKHGAEAAHAMRIVNSKVAGARGGSAGKGLPKSESHKRKISESTIGKTRGAYNK